MSYKILQQDLSSGFPYIFEESKMGQIGLDFVNGLPIDHMNFDKDSIRILDKSIPDIFGSTNKCCVSSKVKDLLEQHVDPKHLNFIETTVLTTSMWGLNILDNIECLDRQESKYHSIGKNDHILEVNELVLNQAAIGGRKLFRVSEYPVKIIIADDILQILLSAGVKGIDSHQDFPIRVK